MQVKKVVSFAFITLAAMFALVGQASVARATPAYTLVSVLGQRDLTETAYNEITAQRGFHLGGVHKHVDAATGEEIYYVYDSGNSRVLAFKSPSFGFTVKPAPDLVFGQNNSSTRGRCNGDSTDTSSAPDADSLCLHRGAFAISQAEEPRFSTMDTDADGNLYVMDQYNNRVLRFNDPFGGGAGEGDTTADEVWGQASFFEKQCNRGLGYAIPEQVPLGDPLPPVLDAPAPNSLCTEANFDARTDPSGEAGGLSLDQDGNMWVVDTINSRVLRFPADVTGLPGKNADVALGQPDLDNFDPAIFDDCARNTVLCQPIAVEVSEDGDRLFVIDRKEPGQNRILLFDRGAAGGDFATGMAATSVWGVGTLNFSRGMDIAADGSLWAADQGSTADPHGRLIHFDTNGNVLGQIDSSDFAGELDEYGQPVAIGAVFGGVDVDGGYLYYTDQFHSNSVVRLDISDPSMPQYAGQIYSGNGEKVKAWNVRSRRSFSVPFGMAIWSDLSLGNPTAEQQLFTVNDKRVMVWNLPASGFLPNFAPADYVITFDGNAINVAVDSNNNRLLVVTNYRILAYDLPVARDMGLGDAQVTIDSLEFNTVGSSTMDFAPWALEYDETRDALWLVDSLNSRVSLLEDPYLSTRQVTLILGQTDPSANECNMGMIQSPTAESICDPSDLEVDAKGDVYIAEGVFEGRYDRPGNKRVIQLDGSDVDAAIGSVASLVSAKRVYGVPNFTTDPVQPKEGTYEPVRGQFNNPSSVGLDRQGRMIVLGDSHFMAQNERVFIYEDPLRNPGAVDYDTTLGDQMIPVPMGQGGYSAFDYSGNLYVQDHTWNRVLIFETDSPILAHTGTEVDEEFSDLDDWAATPTPTPISSATSFFVDLVEDLFGLALQVGSTEDTDTATLRLQYQPYVDLKVGADYELSGQIKKDNVDNPRIHLEYYDKDFGLLGTAETLEARGGKTGWSEVRSVVTIPESFNGGAVHFGRVVLEAQDKKRVVNSDPTAPGTTNFDNIYFSRNITPRRDRPQITSTPVEVGYEGSLYTYDVDADDSDPISYSLDGRGIPDGMTIDSQTGLITWDVPLGALGDYKIIVRASDYGSEDSQTYTLTIELGNQPPRITNKAFTPLLAAAGQLYTHSVLVEDPNAEDVITYRLPQGPTGMSIDSGGIITWTSPTSNIGTVYPASVEVSDGSLSDAYSFDVQNVHGYYYFTSPQPVGGIYSVYTRIDSTGTGNLILGTISLTGPDAGEEIVVVSDQCSGKVLPPGASCFIYLDIQPVSIGTKAATLVIPSNVTSTPILYLGWTLDAVASAGLTAGAGTVEYSSGSETLSGPNCRGRGNPCLTSMGGFH